MEMIFIKKLLKACFWSNLGPYQLKLDIKKLFKIEKNVRKSEENY